MTSGFQYLKSVRDNGEIGEEWQRTGWVVLQMNLRFTEEMHKATHSRTVSILIVLGAET